MRRVSWSVRDVEIAAAGAHSLFSPQAKDGVGGDRGHLAPKAIHRITVETGRAGQQLVGIDQVRRPLFVDQHSHPRVLANQRASGACVVQMNVSEQQRRHVGHGQASLAQRGAERRQRARWPGIDERDAPGAV